MSITDTFNDRVIKNVQNKPNKHNKSDTSEQTSSKWFVPFMNRRMTAVFPEKNQIEVVTVDKLK